MAEHTPRTAMEQKELDKSLYYAAKSGDDNRVKQLVAQGADLESTHFGFKRTPLLAASENGHLSTVKLLVDSGAKLSKKDRRGQSAAHWASKEGHLDVLKYLVQVGINLQEKDDEGQSAAHLASARGHLDVLKYLVQVGINLQEKDNEGQSAAHLASRGGHLDVLKYLVQVGINLQEKDNEGWSAAHLASTRGHLDVLKYLVQVGINLQEKDNEGQSAAHLASARGHLDVLKYLVQVGINLQEKDNDGDNCMHRACWGGHLPVITWLMDEGLGLDTPPNKEGKTPLDVLKQEEKEEYFKLTNGRRQECLKALKIVIKDTDNTGEHHTLGSPADTTKDQMDDPTTEVPVDTSEEYQQLLEKAAKDGVVETQWSNVSVAGASGTGKTSLLNLLILDDPVVVHNSTPVLKNLDVCVAEEEESDNSSNEENTDSSVTNSNTSEAESAPESDPDDAECSSAIVEVKKLKQHVIIADSSKEHLWKIAEKDALQKKLAAAILTLVNNQEENEDEPSTQPPPLLLIKREHLSTSPIAAPPQIPIESQLRPQPISLPLEKSNASKQILELLPMLLKEGAKLSKTHWIHLLDTGGQASFIDIAPALFRFNSVNLVVHKLDEDLDDFANFFYSVDGKVVGREKRRLTNAQLLKSLFSSRTGLRRPDMEGLVGVEVNGETHLLVIGSHYDVYKKLIESKKAGVETLKTKNKRLVKELSDYNECRVDYKEEETKVVRDKKTKKREKVTTCAEVIFPINTLSRKERELKIARKIRKLVSCCYIRAKIPVRWYLIQIEINELKSSGDDLIVIAKILKIGYLFNMSDEETKGALKYFHDLTICLYFSKVLPGVVFLTPQRLFNKLSQIVAVSLGEHDSLVSKGISQRLCKHGTFTKAIFDYFKEDFQEGVFTPDDFLKLMEHLLVITKLPDGKTYFMPSVLECVDDPLEGLGEKYFKVAPLCFTWKDSVPNGLFPSLVQYLQGTSEPDFEPDVNATNYRNKITMHYTKGLGKVVLFELPGFIGVAYSGLAQYSSLICTAIHKGISHIVTTFHWKDDITEPVVSYLCTMQHAEAKPPHICRISACRQYLSCSLDNEYDNLTEVDSVHHLSWKAQNTDQVKKQESTCQPITDQHSAATAAVNQKTEESVVFGKECKQTVFLEDAASVSKDVSHGTSSPKSLMQKRPKLSDAYKLTVSRSAEWNNLGRSLDVSLNYRKHLKGDPSSDEDKLEYVLDKWIETESIPVTWSSLIEALESIELRDVVQAIKEFLQTSKAVQSYSQS